MQTDILAARPVLFVPYKYIQLFADGQIRVGGYHLVHSFRQTALGQEATLRGPGRDRLQIGLILRIQEPQHINLIQDRIGCRLLAAALDGQAVLQIIIHIRPVGIMNIGYVAVPFHPGHIFGCRQPVKILLRQHGAVLPNDGQPQRISVPECRVVIDSGIRIIQSLDKASQEGKYGKGRQRKQQHHQNAPNRSRLDLQGRYIASQPAVSLRGFRCGPFGHLRRGVLRPQPGIHRNAPVLQTDPPRGIFRYLIKFMRNQNNQPFLGRFGQQLNNFGTVFGVEVTRRLIGNQDRRRLCERPRDRQTLLLAAGQAGRTLSALFPQLDLFQNGLGPNLRFCFIGAGQPQRTYHITHYRAAGQNAVALGYKADRIPPIPLPGRSVIVRGRRSVKKQFPSLIGQDAAQNMRQRGFTAAAFTRHRYKFPAGQRKADTV